MPTTLEKLAEVVATVRDRCSVKPTVAIVLGSGLGGIANAIEKPFSFDYSALPHFAKSTAIGHAGTLLVGDLAGATVVAMQGRFHGYEGHAPAKVAFPIRVMHALGARTLIVSNAAGGLNPNYKVGDVVVLDDHINFMFRNPLVGENDPELGPRWPDMCSPYDAKLRFIAESIARDQDFVLHRGVYVSMLGPTYETRAEYRMVRQFGGDVVGMSTVPEVVVATQLRMRVLGLSTVTNACAPDQLGETSGEEVVKAAAQASEKLQAIVTGVIQSIPKM